MVDAGRNMVAIGPCPEEERHIACSMVLPRQAPSYALPPPSPPRASADHGSVRSAGLPPAHRRTDHRPTARRWSPASTAGRRESAGDNAFSFLHLSPSFSKREVGVASCGLSLRAAMLVHRRHPLDPLLRRGGREFTGRLQRPYRLSRPSDRRALPCPTGSAGKTSRLLLPMN